MRYLFVYGSLQSSFNNKYSKLLRKNAILLGKAYIWAKLYKISWYPGIVPDKKKRFKTYGELYYLKRPFILSKLDYYEQSCKRGCEYERKIVEVYWNKKKIKAWAYVYKKQIKQKNLIASGVWNY